MADATAQAKEQQAKGAELKQKSVEEAYSTMGKPTPTQEENDLSALGVTIEEHEDDGSGPQPIIQRVVTRQSESKPSGSTYSTKSATPAPTPSKEPKS